MSFLGLYAGVASRLTSVIGFNFAFQALFASYAVPNKTEKYYDLAGSLGFISSSLLSLYYPAVRSLFGSGPRIPFRPFDLNAHHPRQFLLSAMYLLWAGRLGSFLVQRIHKHGKDSRFDEIKQNPLVFYGAWLGQATWITVVSLPVVLINCLPATQPALGVRDLLGLGVWAAGLGFEILADQQKSAWRKEKDDKKHEEKFISSGLWGISRHPNYLGEVILQAGPPILASAILPSPASYAVFLSPVFSYLLLRHASGVPPLEGASEKKWGSDEGWTQYTRDVGVLLPGLGKGKVA